MIDYDYPDRVGSTYRTPGAWGIGGPSRSPSARSGNSRPVRLAIIRAIWAYVSRTPRATARGAAKAVGLRSYGHAAAALRILEEAGYIERPVGTHGRLWRVVVPFGEAQP